MIAACDILTDKRETADKVLKPPMQNFSPFYDFFNFIVVTLPPERKTRATKSTSKTLFRLKPRALAPMTDLSSTVSRTREISRWITNSQELMTAPLLFCVEMVRTLVNIISQSTEWFTFKKSTNGFKPDVKQKMVLLKINGSCYCAQFISEPKQWPLKRLTRWFSLSDKH